MDKVEKATEIKNARIQFVSLVDKAANLRTFLLKKEKGGKATFSAYGRIVKTDSENHYVTGVVYEPMTEDAHGDYMEEAEITKAAYYFAKNGNKVDIQHSFEPFEGATVVENWVAKADFKIGDEEIRKGTWLLTVEVADSDVWAKIEKGEISGFSMGGVGEYSEEDIDLDNVSKQQETSEKRGLLKQIADALGLSTMEKDASGEPHEAIEADRPQMVEKAGKKMSGKNRETLTGIYESLGAFLKEFDDPEPDDPDKDKDDGEGDGDDKAKTDKDKEEKDVTKQEVETIVSAAIAKAMGGTAPQQEQQTAPQAQGGAQAVEKAEGAVNTAPKDVTPEGIEKMVQEAIAKALTPQQEQVSAEQVQEMITAAVAKAVEPVLKSRGLPSNLNGDGVEKAAGGEQHYLHGIL